MSQGHEEVVMERWNECGSCGARFAYDPKAHRCPGEWERMCAEAGRTAPVNPFEGMSWADECVAKVTS